MIKGLVLAAVAAVGIGSAAQAATVPFGNYKAEITMSDASVYCYFDCEGGVPDPRPFAGLSVGGTVNGVLYVAPAGRPDSITLDLRWRGGVFADRVSLERVSENHFVNMSDQAARFAPAGDQPGGFFTGLFLWADGIEQQYEVSFTNLAPVPLPASAALLPLGFGALALMRKRRQKSLS